MPQLLVALDTIEVKFFSQMDAQIAVNVVHYSVSGVGGASLTDQAVCDAFSTLAAPVYKALQSAASKYNGCRLQKIHPAPVPVAVTSVNGAGVGTSGANGAPPQTCALVTKRTSLAGRKNRGRVYLPFISDTLLLASAQLAAAGLTAVTNWCNAMMAITTFTVGGNSVTLTPVVFNRAPIGSVVIVASTFKPALATQRRRSAVNRGDQPAP